jgi:hypothetical protein
LLRAEVSRTVLLAPPAADLADPVCELVSQPRSERLRSVGLRDAPDRAGCDGRVALPDGDEPHPRVCRISALASADGEVLQLSRLE